MVDSRFVPVGRVVKSHGLKGEVSVASTGDLPFVLHPGLRVWFVPPPATGTRESVVAAVRPGPKGPLVLFEDVTDIDAAQSLRGLTVMARPEDLPAGWDDEPFDAVGMSVVDDERGPIGVVAEVLETGANDVLVVRGSAFGEILIPVIDECILLVDETARLIEVSLLPGLIDSE